jgi:biotin transport system substrate-specific component
MTAVDVFRPSLRRYSLAYDSACVVGGSLLVALSAQVAIPLPFSPVPITGQTLAALLIGALLGRQLGAYALLLYLAEGAIGLPVFAGGGIGLARLAGPTGGFLAGLVVAAYLVGFLAERGWDRRPATTVLAMLFGNIVIYAFGLTWLARFLGASQVLAAGLLPFIPGDLLKLALAAALLPSGWALLGRARK